MLRGIVGSFGRKQSTAYWLSQVNRVAGSYAAPFATSSFSKNVISFSERAEHVQLKQQLSSNFAASYHSSIPSTLAETPREDLVANVRLLKKLGGTPEEVKQYLNMYASVDNRRFGVIKVGGGVINEQLDDLVSSVSTLAKFGLIPIIVHGAGPQLNDTLKQLGIPSSYDEGLRITTPEILKVARNIFTEANFKLVCNTKIYTTLLSRHYN
jgi:hypothetical protein